MDISAFENALEDIEANLEGSLDYGEIAGRAFCSEYHFRRLFGLMCGMSLGEYLRRRRLSRAALDLKRGEKVLDVALKYGYGTPESFSRAFAKFHGVKPMQAKRGAPVKNFSAVAFGTEEQNMTCEIVELPAKTLVGFRAHFKGVPFGEARARQEHSLYCATRGKQWLLYGAAGGREEEYAVVTDVTDEGYDFAIAYEADEWSRKALFEPAVMGFDVGRLGFEVFEISACRAAVFRTKESVHPIADYTALRSSLARFLQKYDFEFAEAPEVVIDHWHTPQREKRFIEICLPIKVNIPH